tara:strand:- start:1589 stop:2326 length:738 start_codon:yes stop_codon:yes gene_type:complete
MAEKIEFTKQVFDKRTYIKTIDTSFNELGVEVAEQELTTATLPTVQEFFDMYNILFYQINELGPNNSHQYLIKTSSDYIGTTEDNSLIDLLQLEIANLRKELLAQQQSMADISLNLPNNSSIVLPKVKGLPSSISDVIASDPSAPPKPPSTPSSNNIGSSNNTGNNTGNNYTNSRTGKGTQGTRSQQQKSLERLNMDVKKYPNSSVSSRSERLNIKEDWIRANLSKATGEFYKNATTAQANKILN